MSFVAELAVKHTGLRMNPKLTSETTVPECEHRDVETMPEDSCQYFYDGKTARF